RRGRSAAADGARAGWSSVDERANTGPAAAAAYVARRQRSHFGCACGRSTRVAAAGRHTAGRAACADPATTDRAAPVEPARTRPPGLDRGDARSAPGGTQAATHLLAPLPHPARPGRAHWGRPLRLQRLARERHLRLDGECSAVGPARAGGRNE